MDAANFFYLFLDFFVDNFFECLELFWNIYLEYLEQTCVLHFETCSELLSHCYWSRQSDSVPLWHKSSLPSDVIFMTGAFSRTPIIKDNAYVDCCIFNLMMCILYCIITLWLFLKKIITTFEYFLYWIDLRNRKLWILSVF